MKKIILNLIFLTILSLSGLFLFTSQNNPLSLRSYAVLSGSMEPTVPVGSVVLARPDKFYFRGDIISFRKGNITVTHRLIDKKIINGGTYYFTKGDANKTPDEKPVSFDKITGKVITIIPLLGYFLAFSKTAPGFVFLVIVPAIIIIFLEILNIRNELRRIKTNAHKLNNTQNNFKPAFLLMVFSVLTLGTVNSAYGFFSSLVIIPDNVITTGTLISINPTPTTPPDPSITPVITNTSSPSPAVTLTSTPTGMPGIRAGDVVINEIMWMGSTGSYADEWLELRNLTSQPVDISNWRIDNASSILAYFEIPAGKTIDSNGFYLIANFDNSNSSSELNIHPDYVNTNIQFNNTYNINGQLILKDKNLNIIDNTPVANTTNWPAGSNEPYKQSMERSNPPGDGTVAGNWHTCTDSACTGTTFWKTSGNNYGTPKNPNL